LASARLLPHRASPLIAISFALLGPCFKKFCASVNYLALGRRKNVRAPIGKLNVEGMQMRAWMVGIAVVVAIGLIWSFAAMSNLVPVDGSEMISRPAE